MPTEPLLSPFTPGAAPTVLIGRDEQLAAVRADLAVVATYGRFQGRVRVDIGSRGVGKTSLLKAIRDAAAEAGLVTAWVTARADESLIGSLVHQITAGLEQIGIDVGRKGRLRDRLKTLSLELGAGPAKAGVEVDVEPGTRPGPAASAAFGALITEAATQARKRGSGGLCLLIDEIQTAPREDLRTLAYAWQELQNATPEPPAAMFAVGLPNAPDVLTAAVTFSERFAFRTLDRLGEADAARVLEVPAAGHRVRWAPELLTEVLELAQGYPYFLQLYGDAIWRAAAPAAGDELVPTLLPTARRAVDDELATMFRARWAKAAPGERRLLAAMAAEMADGHHDAVRRADLAQRLGVTSNDLSVPRRNLIDKGLIEVAERGALRFTVPGFAEFVRQETSG